MPMIQASPAQAVQVAAGALKAGMPVIMTGPPGIGKTRLSEQIAGALGAVPLWDHPVSKSPVDYGGFPDIYTEEVGGSDPTAPATGKGRRLAHFIPIGLMRVILEMDRPAIVLIEDVATAMPSVVAALMQIVHERKIGEHRIPRCVSFILTTNRRQDHAGANGMISPMINRAMVLELGVAFGEWAAWASQANIHPAIMAFLKSNPKALHSNPATAQDPFATPRQYENLSNVITLSPHLLEEDTLALLTIQGCVGTEAATAMLALLHTYRRLPDILTFLRDPLMCALPQEPDLLWCLTSGVIAIATAADREKVALLGIRLMRERPEYGDSLLEAFAAKHGADNLRGATAYQHAAKAGGPLAEGLKRAAEFAEQVAAVKKGGVR